MRRVGHARDAPPWLPLKADPPPVAEPRRRLAREEGREALEPLPPGPEGAGRLIRPVGDAWQGRRQHAGGVERGGGLRLGQDRREPKAGGGQEPDEADEGLRDQGLRRVRGNPEERVRDVFEAASGSRGYRYVTHEPRSGDDPVRVSEKVVRALMREEGLVVAYARKRARYSSYRGEISEAPENLVGRRFAADAPNRLWLTDITEFDLLGGKVCLSPIMDCFDGGLPAWSIGTSPDARLANDSLKAVCGTPGGSERSVINSDRECHYRWPGWIGICERNHLVRSMSKKDCLPDNSAMEGFFGRLKNEFFHHRNRSGGVGTRVLPHA